MKQVIKIVGGVCLKFDSSDVEFSSSPLDPAADQRKTNRFYSHAQVSFGAKNESRVDRRYLYFDENAFTKLDSKNLLYCQFLNLRSSLFKGLDVKYLLSLQYIDIALSQIKELDLRSCIGLRKVIVDEMQTVQVNEGVIVCILGKDDPMDEKVMQADAKLLVTNKMNNERI